MANRIDDDKLEFVGHIMEGRVSDVDLFRWKSGAETRLVARKSVKARVNLEHEHRLRDESSRAATFNHESIVKILGYTQSRSGFGLVMKYYLYGSYQKAFIESNIELPRQEDDHAKLFPLKMRMLREIVSAMEYLHCEYMDSRSLLHLDLKAGNVLLDMQFHAKVSDFGVSKLKKKTHPRSQHSVRENRPTPSIGGTRLFVGPERLFDPKAEASTKSDVYSFGILAWQILTDANPYEGECDNNIDPMIYRVAHQDLRPNLDKIPECVPRMVTDDVVVRCWRKEVDQRPEFTRIHNQIHSIIDAQANFVERITDAVTYAKEIVSEQEVDEPLRPIQQDARGGFNTLLLGARDLKTRYGTIAIVPFLAVLLPLLYLCYIDITTNCGPIIEIENGIANCGDNSKNTSVGTVCKFSCSERYRLEGPDEITCTKNGTWTQSAPICTMVTCPVLNRPPMGKVSCSDDNNVGSECSFSCDENHQIEGPDKITCRLDGGWSGKLPQCSLVQCEPPAAVKYGRIKCTKEDYAVGSVCTVDCLQHHMVKGENGVVCESSGKWSRGLPSCECDDCRTGENCEKTTSWEVFKKDIDRHGKTSHLDFAGHAITCEISHSGFHDWYPPQFYRRCRCRDVKTGHTVECGLYLGRYGSCEHTSAEMIRQMVRKNEYPEACDAEKLARVEC